VELLAKGFHILLKKLNTKNSGLQNRYSRMLCFTTFLGTLVVVKSKQVRQRIRGTISDKKNKLFGKCAEKIHFTIFTWMFAVLVDLWTFVSSTAFEILQVLPESFLHSKE